MSAFADAGAARAALGGFLERLPALDPLLRALVGDDPAVLRLEARDPGFAAVVDLRARPLRVALDAATPGTVTITATADDLHALFAGTLGPGAGLTRRRLVTRGSAAAMMRVMPILFLAPYLYPLHLAAIGRSDLTTGLAAPPPPPDPEEPVNALVARIAYVSGLCLGLLQRRVAADLDLFGALAALGRGLVRGRAAGAGAPPDAPP
jgi:hypothetical protein